MSSADRSLLSSLNHLAQRGALMGLLGAVVWIALSGAVNAASVQDEAQQFFERFVTAQNAHDLDAVASMLWNSEDGAVAMCVGICWRGLRWDEDTGSGSQVNRLFSKVLV